MNQIFFLASRKSRWEFSNVIFFSGLYNKNIVELGDPDKVKASAEFKKKRAEFLKKKAESQARKEKFPRKPFPKPLFGRGGGGGQSSPHKRRRLSGDQSAETEHY